MRDQHHRPAAYQPRPRRGRGTLVDELFAHPLKDPFSDGEFVPDGELSHTRLSTATRAPLSDADHDAVRITGALLGSPHVLAADAEPGDDTVRFTSVARHQHTLTLRGAEPTGDSLLPEPVLTEALARKSGAFHIVDTAPVAFLPTTVSPRAGPP
ncbi:hypothetical protein [Streptomyces syringium]|uniref:hypothetical protein n=1 Tax=Streptomyces syringium TaxID=76729 RepID=UPI0037D5EC37